MDFTNKLNQTAVYWGNPQPSGYGGYTYADGVEVSVRWEDKQETFVSAAGNESLSRAIVYANTDMVNEGYLYLGELTDLGSDISDPTQVDSYEIKAVAKIPSLDATQFLRKAWL